MQLSVVNNIPLNFCLEVFDLDLFARVAFIQMDSLKLMLFSLMLWKKLQRFLMIVLCSLLDYQTLLEHLTSNIILVLCSSLDEFVTLPLS
jgi:hypothetical protein